VHLTDEAVFVCTRRVVPSDTSVGPDIDAVLRAAVAVRPEVRLSQIPIGERHGFLGSFRLVPKEIRVSGTWTDAFSGRPQ